MTEVWRPVRGFEETHLVSSMGRVSSVDREYDGLTPTGLPCKFHVTGKILGTTMGNSGYLRVSLSVNGFMKIVTVHRIMAETFLENPYNYPQVNHIDGCKTHNVIENLEWCSASQNQLHAMDLGLTKKPLKGMNHPNRCLTDDLVREIRRQLSLGINQRQIARAFGVVPSRITFIKQGKAWKHVV